MKFQVGGRAREGPRRRHSLDVQETVRRPNETELE